MYFFGNKGLGDGEEGVGDYGVGLIRYTPRRNGEGHISPGAGVLTNCHCYSTILVNNLTIVNKRVGV